MGSKLYVGNLAFSTTESELRDLFAQHGTVAEVFIAMDKFSGRSRGFAFVTMGSDAEAKAAITGVNGKNVGGRDLTVNEARPKEEGGRSFGGGGGGGGGRSFGGGGAGGGGGRSYGGGGGNRRY